MVVDFQGFKQHHNSQTIVWVVFWGEQRLSLQALTSRMIAIGFYQRMVYLMVMILPWNRIRQSNHLYKNPILLTEEILHHLGCIKPRK